MSTQPPALKHTPVPVLEFTPGEVASQTLEADTLARAAKLFTSAGCLHLVDAFSDAFIQSLREAYFARYEAYFHAEHFEGAKQVGHRRIQIVVDLALPFNSPALYANPLILPILKALLGTELYFGIFGSVTSLPGANEQHFHRDNPLLFGEAVNRFLPPYAINLFVPLVEFNESTGTTRLFPGTHVKTGPEARGCAGVEPVVRPGSCLLMDYRLYHQGTGNRSGIIRPMLFCAYHRPWYKDYVNHKSWPFLRLTDSEYQRIPEEHRSLFGWVEHYRGGLY